MGSRLVLLMILVAFLWSICFRLIVVGADSAPPLIFAALRAVLAGALVTALWFYLLQHAPLNRLNSFTFLTPIFGLLLGWMFFAERFGLVQVAGMVVIVIGVKMIATKRKLLHSES